MNDFNLKMMSEEQFKKLVCNDERTLDVINAVLTPECPKCLTLINKYSSKKEYFKNKYNDENDVRVMFFNKILNTVYSYLLERVLINGLVDKKDDIKDYLKRTGLTNVMHNWDKFKYSHNIYNAFTCYIRIFSCLESTIREISYYAGLTKNDKETIRSCYNKLIEKTGLNNEYKNLLDLLACVRNLIHTMGISADNRTIMYKMVEYKFIKGKFPNSNILNLINLLTLFENDVIDFIDDLFESDLVANIKDMPDNLSTEVEEFEKWLVNS